MFDVETRIFRVHGVDRVYQEAIRAYLREKLNAWCASHHQGDDFVARDWLGGQNRDWHWTPLQKLYNYYMRRNRGEMYAYREAGKAVGRILKDVIDQDEHYLFHIAREFRTVRYRWV